jgi:ABC-type multidrug transport system fused ATPase/permease subunit
MVEQMSDQPHDTRSLFLWLWRTYLHSYKGWLALALVLMAIEGSMLGLLSYMLKPMFDVVFIEGNAGAIWWVGFAILGIFITRAITSVGQKIVLTRISQKSSATIKSELARHLMALDTTFHQTNPPGYLIERVQGDVMGVNAVWKSLVTGAGRDTITLISLLVVTLTVDWRWTLVAMIGTPLMVLPAYIAQRYVRRKSVLAREVAGQMSLRLDEMFHGINPIKLNALERYQSGRYNALNNKRVKVEIQSAMGQALIPGLADIMAGIGFFGVLIYGGTDIIAGEKTVGEFMAFFTAMGFAFEPLRRLAGLSGTWQSAAAGLERLRALFDTQPTLVSPMTPIILPAGPPEIVIENAHLSYGDLPVLQGASFTALAGKTTALVGASGAGKSTIFNVLTRLVDVNQGDVTIAGISGQSLDLAALRGQFSVVTQDALLFDESLRENILLGRTDVEPEHLLSVLDAAHVSDFLPMLAQGLDSPAGPRGSNLSGGQRQRVAIARALLRDTPILLLDEATSALDAQSESVVQKALERLSHGRTTIVIAHRLATVRDADKIVVMDKGRVIDQGTHDELLARDGHYANLYHLQFNESE